GARSGQAPLRLRSAGPVLSEPPKGESKDDHLVDCGGECVCVMVTQEVGNRIQNTGPTIVASFQFLSSVSTSYLLPPESPSPLSVRFLRDAVLFQFLVEVAARRADHFRGLRDVPAVLPELAH